MLETIYNKSILKWAGGKYKLLENILPELNGKRLFDVFGGSGVVSINATNEEIIYNDINSDLVNLFNDISSENFLETLRELFSKNSKEKYLILREEFNNIESSLRKSCLFLYLNKSCFNGLCRYNSKGKFNVPPGDKLESKEVQIDLIKDFQKIIKEKNIKFENKHFEELLKDVEINDVVYMDPPYLPSDEYETAFNTYSKNGFTINDHKKIVNETEQLQKKGTNVIISNTYTEQTLDLYKNATEIKILDVRRSISQKSDGRKMVKEILAIYK